VVSERCKRPSDPENPEKPGIDPEFGAGKPGIERLMDPENPESDPEYPEKPGGL